MKNEFIVRKEVDINASASKVWNALVDPVMIKKYLFGTDAVSEWKEGSPIYYRGVWNGKAYEDKGKIIKLVPEKLLDTTYWSSAYGKKDLPENYKRVTYEIISENNATKLVLTQDNNDSEEERDQSGKNWESVLNGLKKLLEN